jgi:hypothetical protein
VATILTFDIDNIPQQDFLLHVCTTVGVLSKRVVMQGEHLAGRHVQLAAAGSCPFWLRGSAVSACVKILGNVYDFRIS